MPVAAGNPFLTAIGDGLVRASASRTFWLLSGSFFICGATTNGLVGTHLIPAAMDHGIGQVAAAGLLATIGVFDLVGTLCSGWLTDRYDPRVLLAWYYGLRGLSLLALPIVIESHGRGARRVRGLLRPRLGRDGAADRRTHRRHLRSRSRRGRLRLDLRRTPARRGYRRARGRRRRNRVRHLRAGVRRRGTALPRRGVPLDAHLPTADGALAPA